MAQKEQHTAALADAEAAAWATRLDADGGAPDHATQADLEAWLARNTRHRGALLRAQALLHLAAQTANMPLPETLHQTLPAPAPSRAVLSRASRPPRRRTIAAAMGIALAASLALWLGVDPGAQRYATGKGELRRIALADGSALTLDAASAIRVELEPQEREVRLKSGRALFRVSHDQAHPFRVNVGDVTITDIGTVFCVNKEGETVTVMVSEGEVEIRKDGVTTRVTAGHLWRSAPQGPARLIALSGPAAERVLAWSSGRLELDGETLASAMAEFNRHNAVQIRLARPALAQEKLYGAFRLDNPENFARAVALGANVSLRKQDDAWIIE